MSTNALYYGDNLDILRRHIRDASVDLVYLDPPFQSGKDYNVLFKERSGDRSAAQIKAFEDTWEWNLEARAACEEIIEAGGDTSRVMQAFRTFLGDNDLMAYLAMMAPRLIELRRVLKDSGSIYLHCDPTASHYLKLLMDAIFGAKNFLNEIIWYYRGAGVPKNARARRHDVLLWYACNAGDHYFDPDPIRQPYAEATVERFSHYIGNVRGGRDFGVQQLNPKGKHPDDVITTIQPIAPSAKARLGYPTQKPEELLEGIILSSSREGDVVLDPFCGCGTTIVVAQRTDRRWVGIDITYLATNLIKFRLQDVFGPGVQRTYETHGEPVTVEEAKALALEDRHEFENWALGLVGARKADPKKGADKGIDGRFYFHETAGGETRQVILSVKSGKVQRSHVHELRGVLERERGQIGVLITLKNPTRPMRQDAIAAGFYESPWGKHPRIQILTVADLLDGKKIDYPHVTGAEATFRRAPKQAPPTSSDPDLFDQGDN